MACRCDGEVPEQSVVFVGTGIGYGIGCLEQGTDRHRIGQTDGTRRQSYLLFGNVVKAVTDWSNSAPGPYHEMEQLFSAFKLKGQLRLTLGQADLV